MRQTATMRAAEGPLRVGQQFGPRYIIVACSSAAWARCIRRGTPSWSVAVALKVIRPEVTKDPLRRDIERRFKQELLLARQVTHKNVVRIHDLGEIDGIKYITMPFIEGDGPATILLRDEQARGAESACSIARQVAAGLSTRTKRASSIAISSPPTS